MKLVNNYEGKMIGFGDKLSDKEIDSVLAYIKSFWSKENYEYQLKLNWHIEFLIQLDTFQKCLNIFL